MSNTHYKPIAVITNSLSLAFDTLNELHDIREFNGAKRIATRKDGQTFRIIMSIIDTRGCEFSGVLVIPGSYKLNNYEEIYTEVKARIR